MTTYVLLVGIDEYRSPVNPLRGCVADVKAIHALLANRIPKGEADINELLNVDATRGALIEQFRTHLGRATAGDAVIFWYSGHGARQPTSAAPGVEPDGFDETLVLYDSRTHGGADLADKELGALIAEVAKPGVHVFVGLDCCHSGSGTRELLPDDVTIRRAPTDTRVRARSDATYLTPPAVPGRHVLLTGCRSDQTSKEVPIAGRQRGAMTAAFERALANAGPSTTYREVHRAVRSFVAQMAREQVPQLEVTKSVDATARLFDGALTEDPAPYLVTYDGKRWVLDAGVIHGIPPARGSEAARINVLGDARNTLAHGELRDVRPDSSDVILDAELDTNRTYGAVISSMPLPPTPVSIAAGLDELRKAVDRSPFLVSAESAGISVRAGRDGIEIVDAARGTDPVTQVPDEPIRVVQALEQMVRWRQIIDLDNPSTRLTGVTVTVLVNDEAGRSVPIEPSPGAEVLIEYGSNGAPVFTIEVRNGGRVPVYCAVVALSEDYGVVSLLDGGTAKLEPGELCTKEIQAQLPDELWSAGVTRLTDVMKLIVSRTQFDPGVLEQGGLPRPAIVRDRSVARDAPSSALELLLSRVQDRNLSPVVGSASAADWTASSVRVITERLQPGVRVAGGGVELAHGVALQVPAGLVATALLTGSDVVARDLTAPMVPPLLIDEPDAWRPMGLMPVRDAAAPLDVLELIEIQRAESVTPTDPMELTLQESLGADETVLVIGFDGENYLVVGHSVPSEASGTSIRIEQLPKSIDTRSLTGSIRLLFRRFVHKLTGKPAEITRLAMPTVNGSVVTYDDDAGRIAEAAARANRILLLVHGIIGDTAGMVLGSTHGFGAGYDLLLTFDYENLDTPIRVTADQLRQKLVAAGVEGKDLTIVAHSMGGLVSRWMIEQNAEQGRPGLVSHLVTAGTPNGGSPWSVIEDWATAALSFGLNKLQAVFWPASVLAGLVALVEKVDQTLDEMRPGSETLATLFAGRDPKVRYTVLVGDRSLVVHAEPGGRVARILDALKRVAVDTADSLAFLGKPNDIAVSIESALHLPTGRDPKPEVNDSVACDHLTYFSTPAGLGALAEAVAKQPLPVQP